MGYLSHFIVYVFAMLCIIILALFVYKKFNLTNFSTRRSGQLNIEEVLSLTPRKNLYIVNVDSERFLIAGDTERTTLISKLSNKEFEGNSVKENYIQETASGMKNFARKIINKVK